MNVEAKKGKLLVQMNYPFVRVADPARYTKRSASGTCATPCESRNEARTWKRISLTHLPCLRSLEVRLTPPTTLVVSIKQPSEVDSMPQSNHLWVVSTWAEEAQLMTGSGLQRRHHLFGGAGPGDLYCKMGHRLVVVRSLAKYMQKRAK